MVLPQEDHHEKCSFKLTFINFIKANIGAGFLNLAYAEAQIGYIGGSIGLFLLAWLSSHCMHLLLQLKDDLVQKGHPVGISFNDVAKLILGTWGDILVDVALVVTQLGTCVVYILFIVDQMNQVVPNYSPTDFTLVLLPLLAALVLLKSFRMISYTSLIANFLVFFAFFVILVWNFLHVNDYNLQVDPSCYNPPPSSSLNGTLNSTTITTTPCEIAGKAQLWAGINNVPIYFGSCVFAYGVIGVVLPMENSMKRPEQMGAVVTWGMLITSCLYFLIALSGYMVFGENAPDSMTTSLPISTFYNLVRVILCVALYQSISIQFVPAIQIIERFTEPEIDHHVKSEFLHVVLNAVVRIILIFSCAGLAIAIPKLALFISLIGSFGTGLLALILPPVMHLVHWWKSAPWYIKARDTIVAGIGLLGLVTGVYVSLVDIINSFSS